MFLPFKLSNFRTKAVAYDRQGSRTAERSSPIGTFLRRTRLDELPQLYDILVGEMSFADTRRLLPSDQPHEDKTRPGLPGWARINGGRNPSVNTEAALDIRHVNKTSLQLDLKILVQTALFVLRSEWDNAAASGWRDCPSTEIKTGDVIFEKTQKKHGRRMPHIETAGQL